MYPNYVCSSLPFLLSVVPISLVADLHRLSFSSAISVVAVVVLFFIVLIAGPIESNVINSLFLSSDNKFSDSYVHFSELLWPFR